ncbi:hypothetical protein V6U90_20950 [Micromonospora sp. CPCC 206060]|uniref:hypothetical protein n=1 Tax=Micromonospora sp. CPCC 206060 TaxID=3122406 RepID=UPI002FF00C93
MTGLFSLMSPIVTDKSTATGSLVAQKWSLESASAVGVTAASPRVPDEAHSIVSSTRMNAFHLGRADYAPWLDVRQGLPPLASGSGVRWARSIIYPA